RARWGAGLGWFALPLLLLAGGVGAVNATYRFGLGHAPDWACFFEYSLSFESFADPIDPGGAVWGLLWAFCALSTAGVYFLGRRCRPGTLGLAAGAWGFLWAASSYFVSRSSEANVTNLSPVLVTGLALVLYLFARERAAGGWPRWVR